MAEEDPLKDLGDVRMGELVFALIGIVGGVLAALFVFCPWFR